MARIGIPYLDFDALIAAIQALSAPSATNVAVSPTGMHYITEDDAQGALAELDAEAYAINSSLAQKKTTATLPENVYSNIGINQVERSGNIVIVTLGLTISSSIAGVNGLIATLPVGYRPSARVNLPCYGTYYSSNVGFWKVFISSDGTIKTDIGSGTITGTIYIHFSFTVES